MGAAASALRHRGRLQLDAGSVKAPFSRQKSRKIATVTKAPAKKSPAARNVVTHLLIPYRRRRCAAGRNPTPHGRTCGAAPTLRARPNMPANKQRFGHLFVATLFCTSSEDPCTPIRRPHTPCPDHPGARYISMEVPVKEACHVRPSTVALCRSFAVKCTLAAHRCGRYIDFGTVNKRNHGCECAHF